MVASSGDGAARSTWEANCTADFGAGLSLATADAEKISKTTENTAARIACTLDIIGVRFTGVTLISLDWDEPLRPLAPKSLSHTEDTTRKRIVGNRHIAAMLISLFILAPGGPTTRPTPSICNVPARFRLPWEKFLDQFLMNHFKFMTINLKWSPLINGQTIHGVVQAADAFAQVTF